MGDSNRQHMAFVDNLQDICDNSGCPKLGQSLTLETDMHTVEEWMKEVREERDVLEKLIIMTAPDALWRVHLLEAYRTMTHVLEMPVRKGKR